MAFPVCARLPSGDVVGRLLGQAPGGVIERGFASLGVAGVGIDQILLPATTVIAAAPFYRGEILGHVLESETDALFVNRERL